MLKKVCFALALAIGITASCNAHFLDTQEWFEHEPNAFVASEGVQTSKSKPILYSLMFGNYYSVPQNIAEIGEYSYHVYEMQFSEDKPQQVRFANMVFYDRNGDVVYGEACGPYIKDNMGIYDKLFSKNASKLSGRMGTGTETFFLPPNRWKCGAFNKEYVVFYDKTSLRHYLFLGIKRVEGWICTANPKDKTYLRSFVIFDKDARTYDIKESFLNNYGEHKLIVNVPNYDTEHRILPGSIMEQLFNNLLLTE